MKKEIDLVTSVVTYPESSSELNLVSSRNINNLINNFKKEGIIFDLSLCKKHLRAGNLVLPFKWNNQSKFPLEGHTLKNKDLEIFLRGYSKEIETSSIIKSLNDDAITYEYGVKGHIIYNGDRNEIVKKANEIIEKFYGFYKYLIPEFPKPRLFVPPDTKFCQAVNF